MLEDFILYFTERAVSGIDVGWDPMWTCVTVQDARSVIDHLIKRASQDPKIAANYVHKAVRGLSQRFKDAEEPREKAIWALETAFCYERALNQPNLIRSRDDSERWQQMVGFWLWEALKQNESLARQQFQTAAKGRPGIIKILQQDERNKPLLAALQGQQAVSDHHLRDFTPPPPKVTAAPAAPRSSAETQWLNLRELTRPPNAETSRRASPKTTGPSQPAVPPSPQREKENSPPLRSVRTDSQSPADYDPDYWLSHVYHFEYAEYFAAHSMYRRAVEAWRIAAWLYPRFQYRIAGCETLLKCAEQHTGIQECLVQVDMTLQSLRNDFRDLDTGQSARVLNCREQFDKLRRRPVSVNRPSDCEGCAFRSTPLGQCP